MSKIERVPGEHSTCIRLIRPIEDKQFMDMETNRPWPNRSDTFPSDTPAGEDSPAERADSGDGLEALRHDPPADEPDGETELVQEAKRQPGTPGRGPGRLRILLVALLLLAIGAVAPFAWKYFQSYESTDDAQIDGHIDPLSSRIDGTVVGVHAEDDDRVKNGELLVEIDPRDYEVAFEQARARLKLARAQWPLQSKTMPQRLRTFVKTRRRISGLKEMAKGMRLCSVCRWCRRNNTISISPSRGSMRRKSNPLAKRRARRLRRLPRARQMLMRHTPLSISRCLT
jgi:hypothetical protein